MRCQGEGVLDYRDIKVGRKLFVVRLCLVLFVLAEAKLAVATPLVYASVGLTVPIVSETPPSFPFNANTRKTPALRVAETEHSQFFSSAFTLRTEILNSDGSRGGLGQNGFVLRFAFLDQGYFQFIDNSFTNTETVNRDLYIAESICFKPTEALPVLGLFNHLVSLLPSSNLAPQKLLGQGINSVPSNS